MVARLLLRLTNLVCLFIGGSVCWKEPDFVHHKYARCAHISYRGKPSGPHNDDRCHDDEPVCQTLFNISYIVMPPYSPTDLHAFIRLCCGPCARYKVVNTFANITEVSMDTIESSHFVYPFLTYGRKPMLHGRYFIPVRIDLVGAWSYLILSRSCNQFVQW